MTFRTFGRFLANKNGLQAARFRWAQVGVALLLGHWLFGLGDVMATICAAMSFDEPFQCLGAARRGVDK